MAPRPRPDISRAIHRSGGWSLIGPSGALDQERPKLDRPNAISRNSACPSGPGRFEQFKNLRSEPPGSKSMNLRLWLGGTFPTMTDTGIGICGHAACAKQAMAIAF